jgi:hypothetical protein
MGSHLVIILFVMLLGFVVNTFLVWHNQFVEAVFLCLISTIFAVLIDFNTFDIVAYIVASALWIFTFWWNTVAPKVDAVDETEADAE